MYRLFQIKPLNGLQATMSLPTFNKSRQKALTIQLGGCFKRNNLTKRNFKLFSIATKQGYRIMCHVTQQSVFNDWSHGLVDG